MRDIYHVAISPVAEGPPDGQLMAHQENLPITLDFGTEMLSFSISVNVYYFSWHRPDRRPHR